MACATLILVWLQKMQSDIQQHLLTIQQLTEQKLAFAALQKPWPQAEQQCCGQQRSNTDGEVADGVMGTDTSSGPENKAVATVDGRGSDGNPLSEIPVIGDRHQNNFRIGVATKPSPSLVSQGTGDNEVSYHSDKFMAMCSAAMDSVCTYDLHFNVTCKKKATMMSSASL